MKIVKSLFAAALCSTVAITAQAKDFVASDNSKTTKLCITAAEGNKAAMHNAIKSSGWSKQFVVNNVQCNGQAIGQFVANNGKNPEGMLKVLDTGKMRVSITDIAMNRK